ncbi:MAG: biotin--[acetyl-CoA-carboxylase] ligase [Cyclobacteriaceae bacterium]|nr:biotin--[acetyl-CoA-carboxylase] ligase [Cyclobacteriaceae bacterium]
MHKFFAKTLFAGKNIDYLPDCHSTNDFLLQLARQKMAKEGHVVVADYQSHGKGQRGSSWVSEPGKNLLFSLLIKPSFLPLDRQYLLTLMTANALHQALAHWQVDKVEIKWPNDIYLNNRKAAGILCESSLMGHRMEYAVLGMGVNLNQRDFGDVQATSLWNETGQQVIRDEVLEQVLLLLEKWYAVLKDGNEHELYAYYHQHLRWKDERRVFRDAGGEFSGTLRGIDEKGCLVIEKHDRTVCYTIKELIFIR